MAAVLSLYLFANIIRDLRSSQPANSSTFYFSLAIF